MERRKKRGEEGKYKTKNEMKENKGGEWMERKSEKEAGRERAEGKYAGIPLILRPPTGYESSQFDELRTPCSLRFTLPICRQLSTSLTW